VGSAEPTLLTTVIDDTKIRAYFEMSERAVLPYLDRRPNPKTGETKIQTRKDFSVQLTLTNGAVYKHPGKLDFVDNKIDPATRTIHVRAEFPNPDGELAAGMFAQIGLPIPLPKAVLIPQVAISSDLAGTYVWVVDPGNVVRRNGVETGPSVGEKIVVAKGLKGGEKVIVAGVQRAREGGKVAPEFAKEEKKTEKPEAAKEAKKE
jgi:RND family efflux transporter MFP subunit